MSSGQDSKGGGLLKREKGTFFYLSMLQGTCESIEQHTSLPYFDLQVSFRGNFPPIEANEQALSDTVVGE